MKAKAALFSAVLIGLGLPATALANGATVIGPHGRVQFDC